jgi:hypothetical protein
MFYKFFMEALQRWAFGTAIAGFTMCTVKKIRDFTVPSRDVSNQTLPDREKLHHSRQGRVWLVTSRLGTGKNITFFYSVAQILFTLIDDIPL